MIDLVAVSLGGVELYIGVIILAFCCELLDSSLGMGYGTTLTPVLLAIGFDEAITIIPCVLLSQFLCGIIGSAAHHKEGNVNLRPGSKHLNVALILAACGMVGVTVAVFVALEIPNDWLKAYIGLMVLIMGIVLMVNRNKTFKFSYTKIAGIGALAAFNKGMSGGGYGPLVTGGQILSGINGDNAVGITSLAEGLTSFIGVAMYLIIPALIMTGRLDWSLAPSLIIGAVVSVPFSTKIVKRLDIHTIKIAIGALTISLGLYTLMRLFI